MSRRTNSPTSQRYYHGGAPGLQPGDMLVPASELTVRPPTYAFGDYPADDERVYITTSRLAAEHFASVCAGRVDGRLLVRGDLYQVTPVGDLEEDSDFPGNPKYLACPRARIDRVIKTNVQHNPRATLEVHQHLIWDDGTPMYDRYGLALPPQTAVDLGITSKDLRTLGVLPDHQDINRRCNEILLARGITKPRT